MPAFNSAPKELARLVFCRNLFRHQATNVSNYSQIRCLSAIASTSASSGKIAGGGRRNSNFSDFENSWNVGNAGFQKRGFFGNIDGVGNALSKVYEERRVLGYSPEQLFNVAAAVDMYQDFLPWCRRSEIIRRNPDGTFDAEFEIGFKFLVESYVSRVELSKPKFIKTTASQSSLFHHLINVWEFNPGPVPRTCSIHFLVNFQFQSPLYGQMANMFFKEVVSLLFDSVNDRCQLIYGSGVPLLENSYEQRA